MGCCGCGIDSYNSNVMEIELNQATYRKILCLYGSINKYKAVAFPSWNPEHVYVKVREK